MRGRTQFEVLLRMDQCVVRDESRHVRQLGGFGAKEFAPGRRVEEQIGNGDGGSARHSGIVYVQNFPACNFHSGSRRIVAGGRLQRDARHGSDRGQRLSTKAQGGNREQVVGCAQFRCRMPLKGQQCIVAIHTLTVIGNPDQLSSARLNLNPDAVRPRIQRVFQQLLHD